MEEKRMFVARGCGTRMHRRCIVLWLRRTWLSTRRPSGQAVRWSAACGWVGGIRSGWINATDTRMIRRGRARDQPRRLEAVPSAPSSRMDASVWTCSTARPGIPSPVPHTALSPSPPPLPPLPPQSPPLSVSPSPRPPSHSHSTLPLPLLHPLPLPLHLPSRSPRVPHFHSTPTFPSASATLSISPSPSPSPSPSLLPESLLPLPPALPPFPRPQFPCPSFPPGTSSGASPRSPHRP
jgi:hypothetical protein